MIHTIGLQTLPEGKLAVIIVRDAPAVVHPRHEHIGPQNLFERGRRVGDVEEDLIKVV